MKRTTLVAGGMFVGLHLLADVASWATSCCWCAAAAGPASGAPRCTTSVLAS